MEGTAASSGLYPSNSVKVAETADGAVLLDIRQGLCFSINPVGAIIWKHIREGCDSSQIAQYVVQAFDIPAEQARNDVQEFIEDLKQKQLVHERGGAANDGGLRRKVTKLFLRVFSNPVL
jgi:Coenzyme PQQ synthesis protein D (PqqD)